MLRLFPHHHEQKHDKPDPLSPDTLSYLPAFLAYRVDNYWREILLSDKKMVLLTKTTFQKLPLFFPRTRLNAFFVLSILLLSRLSWATIVLEKNFPDLVHEAEVITVGTVAGIRE